jgi:hypothetical protein
LADRVDFVWLETKDIGKLSSIEILRSKMPYLQ